MCAISSNGMSKVRPISGFPEWLPEQRIIEERLIEQIRSVYCSHGFVGMETPSVELLSTLAGQGVIDKEIYVLRRARASEDEEGELALHFDLTVPFARYVAQHYSKLDFPFRRYCLQKVWRGDRPQRGRFREFYQFDIDTVAREDIPLACDAEIVTVIDKAFAEINIARHMLGFNNRKVLCGFYQALKIDEKQQKEVLIAVDKLDKIAEKGVSAELVKLGIAESDARKILQFMSTRVAAADFAEHAKKFAVTDDLFQKGVSEITEVLALLPEETRSRTTIDFSLARGLAYYTGTVFEVRFKDHPEFGSAAGGGRYENLTEQFISQKLPAVGASIGLTRLLDLVFEKKLIQPGVKCPSKLLVAVYDETSRAKCNEIAETLRKAGVECEVFYKSLKLGKQIDYADSKGIQYVLFFDPAKNEMQIKNLATKEQIVVKDLAAWSKGLAKKS
jgi:histidyl-tRNA synthetase